MSYPSPSCVGNSPPALPPFSLHHARPPSSILHCPDFCPCPPPHLTPSMRTYSCRARDAQPAKGTQCTEHGTLCRAKRGAALDRRGWGHRHDRHHQIGKGVCRWAVSDNIALRGIANYWRMNKKLVLISRRWRTSHVSAVLLIDCSSLWTVELTGLGIFCAGHIRRLTRMLRVFCVCVCGGGS